jgi:hypothetical protein
MGGYELVRSDDAPALAVDLEAGGGGPAKRAAGTSPAPAPARQRLVSLDVFRGITVLVRTQQKHSHPPSAIYLLILFLICY